MRVQKQPAETIELPVDFGLAAASATVSSLSRAIVMGSVGIGAAVTVAAGQVTLGLSGGTDGERYLVTVRAAIAGGEALEREIEVAVIDAAWAMPDGGVPYLSIAEFVDTYGLDETIAMTGAGDGRIDRAMLISALRAAQGLANTSLAARYAVPLATVPDAIKTAIGDIARARLYPRGVPDGVATAAKDAVSLLGRIASGALPLPLPTGTEPDAVSSDAPVLVRPGRQPNEYRWGQ